MRVLPPACQGKGFWSLSASGAAWHWRELDDEAGDDLLDVRVPVARRTSAGLYTWLKGSLGQVVGENRRRDDEPLVLLPRCEGVVLEPL